MTRDCPKCHGVGASPAYVDRETNQMIREDCDYCNGTGVTQ